MVVADLLAGDIVTFAQVEVTTAFDAAATLTLGFQSGTGIEVLNLGNTDMELTDVYASGTAIELASDDTLELVFNPSGATVGAAQLIVIIERI